MHLCGQTLLENKWVKRDWDGNEQFEDVATGKLMMLPTDMVHIYIHIYISNPLFFLHEAEFMLCISAFPLTPETAWALLPSFALS